MQLTDEMLVQRCLDGDKEAFGFLVDRYKESVFGLAYSKVGNVHDAQDIAQEAFLNAYKNLRHDEAIGQTLIQEYENDPMPMLVLGCVYFNAGKYESAIQEFKKVLKHDESSQGLDELPSKQEIYQIAEHKGFAPFVFVKDALVEEHSTSRWALIGRDDYYQSLQEGLRTSADVY
jgi:tetratricopeptide (TPR) repeat protein